jgi:hypothetical protein
MLNDVFHVFKDLAERRMMNRRFYSPYDDFISTQYDEYQSSFHSSLNSAHNDIYGRMYSDRNYGIKIE